MNSDFGKLSGSDFWKGFVMFVISGVLAYLGSMSSLVTLTWQQILGVALTSAAAYLLKNLGTTSDGKVLGIG